MLVEKKQKWKTFICLNYKSGDESVTMCGVAQEDISKDAQEDGERAYTTPWHVTLKSVRTLFQ